MLYSLHEPWAANTIADMAKSSIVVFEHANFANLSSGNYGKAQMGHFMNKCSWKSQKVHEEISEVIINFFEKLNLQTFQSKKQ